MLRDFLPVGCHDSSHSDRQWERTQNSRSSFWQRSYLAVKGSKVIQDGGTIATHAFGGRITQDYGAKTFQNIPRKQPKKYSKQQRNYLHLQNRPYSPINRALKPRQVLRGTVTKQTLREIRWRITCQIFRTMLIYDQPLQLEWLKKPARKRIECHRKITRLRTWANSLGNSFKW